MSAFTACLPPAHLYGALTSGSGILRFAPVMEARDSGLILGDSVPPPSSGEVSCRPVSGFHHLSLSARLTRLQEGLSRACFDQQDVHPELVEAWVPIYLGMTLLMQASYFEKREDDVADKAELATMLREWRLAFDRHTATDDPERLKSLRLVWMISAQLHKYSCMPKSDALVSKFRPSQYDLIRIYFNWPHYSRHSAPLLETVGACFEGSFYLEKALEVLETPPTER